MVELVVDEIERREGSFFFSSRRRHTRSLCDWSSDVCSSDLPYAQGVHERGYEALEEGRRVVGSRSGAVRGAGQVRCIHSVGSRQGGHDPLPVEGVVAGPVQQNHGRTLARGKIADGHPVDLDVLLLKGYIHSLGPFISHPSFMNTNFLRDGRCCLSSGRVELLGETSFEQFGAV